MDIAARGIVRVRARAGCGYPVVACADTGRRRKPAIHRHRRPATRCERRRDAGGRRMRARAQPPGGGLGGGGGGSVKPRRRPPAALAASARGRLYVADRGNQRVSVYTHQGLYLFSFTGGAKPAALNKPTQAAGDAEERVYVLDAEGDGRVSVFDHNGRLLKQVGARQFGAGETRPVLSALAVDTRGLLVVA